MQRFMLKSKIHRAVVTDANLDYEGSIAIDGTLMESAGLLPYEQVDIYNISNGSRFRTYAIPDERDSNAICINGAAAHLAKKDDIIIIASYAILEDETLIDYSPVMVYVDKDNRITKIVSDNRCSTM
jgi:aspartate 1-decarboxylase